MAQLGFNRLGRLGQVVLRNCTRRHIAAPLPQINATQMRTRVDQANPGVAYPRDGIDEAGDEFDQRNSNNSNRVNIDGRELRKGINDMQNFDLIPGTRRISSQSIVTRLDRAFNRFEEVCQKSERVVEGNFVKTFRTLTDGVRQLEESDQMNDNVKTNLTVLSAMLLRCCGSLMSDTPEKVRELLAGNLWTFMKEKKIPLDISHYNALIRVLNENQTEYDPQMLLDEIMKAHLKPDRITYQRLIHRFCVLGDIIEATKLLETMKDMGMELNESTFASLIIGYSKQETPLSTSEMFDLMRSNGVEPTSRSYAAALTSQAQLLGKNETASEELNKIYDLMVGDEIQFNTSEIIDVMTHLSSHKKDETIAKILNYLNKDNGLRNINDQYRLTSALFRIGEYEEAAKLYWSQKPSDTAIRYSNLGMYYIRLMASCKNVPVDHCIEECSKLKDRNHNSKTFYHLFFQSAKSGNLDLVRAAIEKIKEDAPVKCQYYWPLLAQSTDEETLVDVLKNHLSPNMRHDDLLDTFSLWVWPRYAENIPKLFELNRKHELNYDNNLLISSLMKYSIQEDKIMNAINFISEAGEEIVSSAGSQPADDIIADRYDGGDDDDSMVQPRQRQSRGSKGGLVGRLLDQIAEHTKDPAMVEKAFNLCQSPNQPVSSGQLNALVKVHLINGDVGKAMEVFIKLAQEHHTTPCKQNLIIYCLENKDPDNLQKIMNVSSEIHGEMNSLFDLAVCCLQCGKLKQAQKIFASPGFRVQPFRVYDTCRSLSDKGNIDILENYVHLTRDMCDINQEQLHHSLISAYERTSNAKRVLDLWTRMQEEDFYPSKRTLVMIAKVLEKNGIEVPFRKPVLDLERI